MTHMLDVFRLENNGVLWLESAATFECAKARVQELAVRSPGVFLIMDQSTGYKHVIKLEGTEQRRTTGDRKSEREGGAAL